MSFAMRPSDSGCRNLFPRASAAVVSLSIAALERPARALGHRLRAHVATHKLPPSQAALYSKIVSSLSQFASHESDERIFPRCGDILLPSSSAPPLTGSYPAGMLSLFERLRSPPTRRVMNKNPIGGIRYLFDLFYWRPNRNAFQNLQSCVGWFLVR